MSAVTRSGKRYQTGLSSPSPKKQLTSAYLAKSDVVTLILSHLVHDDPQSFCTARLVNRLFADRAFIALKYYLLRKTHLSAKEMKQLHLLTSTLLIAKGVLQIGSSLQQTSEVRMHWQEQTLPEVFAFLLYNCEQLTHLDLSHERYSVATLTGRNDVFGFEAATLSLDQSLDFQTPSQIEQVTEPILQGIQRDLPLDPTLSSVKFLILDQNQFDENALEHIHTSFPNVHTISIIGGSHHKSELSHVFHTIPSVKQIVLLHAKILGNIKIEAPKLVVKWGVKRGFAESDRSTMMGSLCVDS